MKELKAKWWVKKSGEACDIEGSSGNAQMDLGKLGGVFIVVVFGMVSPPGSTWS